MTLDQLKRRIERAERVLDGRQSQLSGNVQQMRGTWRAAWTPGRIVVVGAALGFVFGKLDPERTAGRLAGKFGAAPKVLQTLTALSGLFAASRAQAASDSADDAAEHVEQAAQAVEEVTAPSMAVGVAAASGVSRVTPANPTLQPRPAEAATELSDP